MVTILTKMFYSISKSDAFTPSFFGETEMPTIKLLLNCFEIQIILKQECKIKLEGMIIPLSKMFENTMMLVKV